MPLQKWMTEHGHPGWYSWLVVLGGSLVSMMVAVGISVSLNNQAIERERQAQAQEAERANVLREASREASCLTIRTMADVYADPSTETGEKARAAWISLGRTFGCKE